MRCAECPYLFEELLSETLRVGVFLGSVKHFTGQDSINVCVAFGDRSSRLKLSFAFQLKCYRISRGRSV